MNSENSRAAARHPIALIHRHPEPSAPSARAFLTLLATFETPRSGVGDKAFPFSEIVGSR